MRADQVCPFQNVYAGMGENLRESGTELGIPCWSRTVEGCPLTQLFSGTTSKGTTQFPMWTECFAASARESSKAERFGSR
jgi:hypothetical protein